ncbi:MAG: NADH dehydrogenase (quinone) subunit D [Desulfosoma sp.]|uniref:NADH dehydrogenase (quinone) subunit D n=1 Tax=Desulfosoma sp. TaxID=2603217 RepID=UPI004049BC3E
MSELSERLILNVGPQHPSTHGVLRVVAELEGEVIVRCTPDIGYLHRGIEKLMESKTYHQCLPLTDRIDYLAGSANNLGFVLAVEKLLDIEVPPRARYLRVIMAEMTRISSHLFWLATHAHDLGAMTPLFYTFREREQLMDLFEAVAGGRLFPCYFRIGGVARDVPDGWTQGVREFCRTFPEKMKDYEALLTKNPIWIKRTRGVGVLTVDEVLDYGLSGPVARGSGIAWDVRRADPYCGYDEFDFVVPVGENGDTYDRYLVRLEEMRQSARIILQALDRLPSGDIAVNDATIAYPPKKDVYTKIESLIQHFLLVVEGIRPPKGEVFHHTEAPKGELGFYIVSDGSSRPFRVKVRTPSFVNLQVLSKMAEGRLLADLIALIGTIDIVLADVDR